MHTGGQPGTSAELLMMPQEHSAVAVLANLEGVPIRELVRAILAELQMPVPAAKP
jgi:hypothetical protein